MSLLHIENYRVHPTNNRYYVFNYRDKQQADYFEQLLKEKNISYERDILEGDNVKYVFGIKKQDMSVARKLNYLAVGKYREKFIPNKYFRWVVITLFLGGLLLAIAGKLTAN